MTSFTRSFANLLERLFGLLAALHIRHFFGCIEHFVTAALNLMQDFVGLNAHDIDLCNIVQCAVIIDYYW